MENIIQANQIYKSYKLGQAKVEVLKGLDFTAAQGEMTAIVGGSGSGKSTLLHLLGGLDSCDKGQIHFRRKDIAKFSSAKINQYRNKKIGFVFQFYHLLDELNILENAMIPAMASTGWLGWLKIRKNTTKKAKNLLERLGMAHRLKHKPYQLSGGERQRVAIARALINDPEILLADEPTGNLDTQTGNGILEVLEELNRDGQTIIMVTHDMKIAQRARRTIQLIDGRIVENSACED